MLKTASTTLLLFSCFTTVFAGLCTVKCPKRFSASGHIIACLVRGVDLEDPEPFMASLRDSSGGHYCGGTLIHPKVVLTAAHCVDNEQKPGVDIGRCRRVGSDDDSGFDSYQTVQVFTHEKYNSDSLDNDIALLLLSSESSRTLLPLASSDSCFQEDSGCEVRLLGWGTDASDGDLAFSIQDALTTSVSRSDCQNLLGLSTITDSMICAGELMDGRYDSCQGDSGGPMIQDGKQVGIVSFGFGCGNAQSPGVYTSVPKLRAWIDAKLRAIDSMPLSEGNPCDCAQDGISNGVATSRYGCRKHLAQYGDSDTFCMTVGGLDCSLAKPSERFLGAAWVLCSSSAAAQSRPCDCAQDGISNGISTGFFGCKRHLAEHGSTFLFCMTVGGLDCPSALSSEGLQGAAWILCN